MATYNYPNYLAVLALSFHSTTLIEIAVCLYMEVQRTFVAMFSWQNFILTMTKIDKGYKGSLASIRVSLPLHHLVLFFLVLYTGQTSLTDVAPLTVLRHATR